jgi:ribosomal protein S17E
MAPARAQCSPRPVTERRVIIEKYYQRLTQDFDTNKRICEEVAIIQSKRLRNKIAGFTTVSSSTGKGCVWAWTERGAAATCGAAAAAAVHVPPPPAAPLGLHLTAIRIALPPEFACCST